MPSHHPCADPCQAPSACSEVGPCQSVITLLCPCGRVRQSVRCGRSISNVAGRNNQQQLKCTSECALAQRNARLAEALGIDTGSRDKTASAAVYSDELVGFARLNDKFLAVVEKALAEFVPVYFSDNLWTNIFTADSLGRAKRFKCCHRCLQIEGNLFTRLVGLSFSVVYGLIIVSACKCIQNRYPNGGSGSAPKVRGAY